MIDDRIIFTNAAGGVSVIIPTGEISVAKVAAKDVPPGLAYRIVKATDLPPDRTFRNAWEMAGGTVAPNIIKAKGIAHDRRRAARAARFAPLDAVIAAQIPGKDLAEAEAARAAIRDHDAALQGEIDACASVAALKSIIDREAI